MPASGFLNHTWRNCPKSSLSFYLRVSMSQTATIALTSVVWHQHCTALPGSTRAHWHTSPVRRCSKKHKSRHNWQVFFTEISVLEFSGGGSNLHHKKCQSGCRFKLGILACDVRTTSVLMKLPRRIDFDDSHRTVMRWLTYDKHHALAHVGQSIAN